MESIFRLYSELPRHKKDALIFFAGIHTVLLIIIIFLLILVLSNLLNSSSFFIVLILLGIISFFASFGHIKIGNGLHRGVIMHNSAQWA